ncbi:unnamed protein product [Vicia faba]|uniref:Uncharacterized protein n=1 Tax=Vicia faba TaxID=3906 RepID=A0AAV0YJN6_VICFA|nr:unnamed protein product [Vicia faba]
MAKLSEDGAEKSEIRAEFDAAFGFPNEFPYEIDSVETENSDEEDFFAGLTRRLSQASLNETRKEQLTVQKPEEKIRVMAGSPQSTLARIGSWSGRSGGSSDGSPNGSTRVPSPTTVPFSAENDAWDVLYAAAGEVARLKMSVEASLVEIQNKRGVLGGLPPPVAAENRAAAFFSNPNPSLAQYNQVKQQCDSVWGRQAQAQAQAQAHALAQAKATSWSTQVLNRGYDYEGVKCTRPMPRSIWHSPIQAKHQNNPVLFNGSGSRPVSQIGSGVKKACGGTGVFLPRQYVAPLPESRNKTNCASVLVPTRVIHALNMNIDDYNGGRQPRFSNDFGVDYESLLARKNALLIQQRLRMQREEAASYEARLPQEWTY